MLEHKANQYKVFFHGTLDFYFYFVNLMVEDFLLNLTMQYWKKARQESQCIVVWSVVLPTCTCVSVCLRACMCRADVHESSCSLLRLPPNGGQAT